jgi:dienelactone hydrolase
MLMGRDEIPVVSAIAFCLLAATVARAAEPKTPVYRDQTRLLVYLDAEGKEHAITRAADWPRRRAHILANLQRVMGELPGEKARVPLAVEVTETVRTADYVRKKLTYAAEKGDRVPAYLLVPLRRKGRLPAVLCLHQTNGKLGKAEPAGLGGSSDLHCAAELARRGYVTLAPDYPSFGDYRYDFGKSRHPSGTIKAVWNNLRAVDLLQSLPEVDGKRIGCIGHSLGGHNALFTAAFDPRMVAVVSSCGFTSFPKYYRGNLEGWTSPRYMPRIASVYGSNPAKVPFDFPEVVAALAPRPFLAVAPLHDDNFEVSGVRDVIRASAPVYALLGAKEKLSARHPDCKHAFPAKEREQAYRWLDRWLKVSDASQKRDARNASAKRR